MSRLLCLLLLLAACDHLAPPQVDPAYAHGAVCDGLEEAAEHARNQRWDNAAAALGRARLQFDGHLEPHLRETLSSRQVLALEYRWSLLQNGVLKRRSGASSQIEGLATKLREVGRP